MSAVASALLAETRRRPGRLVLTGLAITVATVFAAGTFLLGETLRGYLVATVVQTPAATTAVVLPERLSGEAGSADLVARVAAVDGVAGAVGVRTGHPTVSGAGVTTMWQLASDPMGGPLTRLTGPPLRGVLPTGPDEAAVGESTAARTGLAPGDRVTVRAGDAPPRTVTVTAVVPASDDGLNTLVAAPGVVAELGGLLDQVDVVGAPGVDAAALSGRIAAALGAPDAVRTGTQQRAAEVEDASDSVSATLIAVGTFAGLAVVAGAVVVASTFRIVLTQRRTQMALLRCVGARRGQVVRAVLVEAVITGVVAGVLGLGIALLAGYGLLAVIRAIGADGAPELVVWWPGLAGVLVVAVLATVVAGLAPALAASRIPPVAALGVADAGDAGVPHTGRRVGTALALATVAGGLAWLAFAGASDSRELAMLVVAASGLVAFAALGVAGPVLVRALVAVAARPIAVLGGGAARLASANAAQVPRRTAATISVLALGVGLTSALLVGVESTMAGAERNIAEQFPSDVVISAADGESAQTLAARLAGDPRLAVHVDDATVFVDPARGQSVDVARTAVEEGVGGEAGVLVQYAADARAQVSSTLGTAQLIGFGLVGMTALVAVVGVGVTLTLSVTERTRETGLLRAVGLTRRGVRAMVAWEAALSGVGAALIGAVVGSTYGALGVGVLRLVDGPPSFPIPSLTGLVIGVVVVAALAATAPAVRAGRVPPIRALQEA